ncbi:MAG: TPM domain-containing protein [Clostridia bacterium]|nr:TPM domain-containing protein [Clostridia bacterium]
MAKYCGWCGSILDINTGLCPNGCAPVAQDNSVQYNTVPYGYMADPQNPPVFPDYPAGPVFQEQEVPAIRIEQVYQPPEPEKKRVSPISIVIVLLCSLLMIAAVLFALSYFDIVSIPGVSDIVAKITNTADDEGEENEAGKRTTGGVPAVTDRLKPGETTSAYIYHSIPHDLLDDDSGLFSDSEKDDLTRSLNDIKDKYHFEVVIHTTDTFTGKSSEKYADDYYDRNGCGYGVNHDGCLIVINMDEREWYLMTCGTGISVLTDARIQAVGDAFSPYLSKGEYYDAMTAFLSQIEDYLNR